MQKQYWTQTEQIQVLQEETARQGRGEKGEENKIRKKWNRKYTTSREVKHLINIAKNENSHIYPYNTNIFTL